MKRHVFATLGLLAIAFTLTACAPKVGSDAWCKELATQPKLQWSMQEAADYTKYCVLNQKPQ